MNAGSERALRISVYIVALLLNVSGPLSAQAQTQPPVFSQGVYPAAPVPPAAAKEAPPRSAATDGATTLPDASLVIATRAWRYFQISRSKSTGLFDSVLGYHHTTMWDLASGLAATICAEKLHLIERAELLLEFRRMLASLSRMPLFENQLPNREYHTETLALHDPGSTQPVNGSGWSATDLGRLLLWLKIAANWYPELKPAIEEMLSRWAL